MRKILFQAKKLKTDEFDVSDWAIGLPREVGFGKWVIDSFHNRIYEIDPETLCQYTGVCDSNDVQIFENDVIQIIKDKYADKYIVVWDEEDCGFFLVKLNSADKNNPLQIPMSKQLLTDSVIIGSIFDFEVEENE